MQGQIAFERQFLALAAVLTLSDEANKAEPIFRKCIEVERGIFVKLQPRL